MCQGGKLENKMKTLSRERTQICSSQKEIYIERWKRYKRRYGHIEKIIIFMSNRKTGYEDESRKQSEEYRLHFKILSLYVYLYNFVSNRLLILRNGSQFYACWIEISEVL